MIKFIIDDIEDRIVRENFQRLEEFLSLSPFLNSEWSLYEVKFTSTAKTEKVEHNLGFIPKDAVIISRRGDQGAYMVYDKFDKNYVYIYNANPCTLRFLVGRSK